MTHAQQIFVEAKDHCKKTGTPTVIYYDGTNEAWATLDEYCEECLPFGEPEIYVQFEKYQSRVLTHIYKQPIERI